MPVDVTGARVLVIDDNPVNREILLEQLRSWGFDCAAAESGAIGLAFLDRAAQLGASVDCVILDYQMPGMNGADVAKAMCSDSGPPRIPVMLLTSVDQIDFGRMVLEYGIAAHLTKPARSAVLLGTVIAAIQKARSQAGRVRIHARAPQSSRGRPSPCCAAARRHRTRGRRTPANVPLDILVAEDNEVNQLVFGQILSTVSACPTGLPATAAPRSRCIAR